MMSMEILQYTVFIPLQHRNGLNEEAAAMGYRNASSFSRQDEYWMRID